MRTPRLVTVRIALLLGCLAAVGLGGARERSVSRAWERPLPVTVFPIAGDASPATAAWVSALRDEDLADIDAWAAREARRHGLALARPFRTALGPEIGAPPPSLPAGAGPLRTLGWGLHLRWWAWRHTPDDPDGPDGAVRVRLFAVFHADGDAPLAHSVGLQKGLLGVVHAWAMDEQMAQNNIVLAHELLHTVGASDKYDAAGGPRFPEGYADPARVPLHPQRLAEVMVGRRPLRDGTPRMAEGLSTVVINDWTAREIRWLE